MSGTLRAVILAAGRGTRLGRSGPKCLTLLGDGRTILQRQLDNLQLVLGDDVDVTVVVGHLATHVIEAAPGVRYVYNPDFATTNTARSLALAMTAVPAGDLVWMNGDVVFEPEVLVRLLGGRAGICLAVQEGAVAQEEVKYVLDSSGWVRHLSKDVVPQVARGESVGVNLVRRDVRGVLLQNILACTDTDYFEKGVEAAIAAGVRVDAVDVADLLAVEVDTPDDLVRARQEYAATLQAYVSRTVADGRLPAAPETDDSRPASHSV